VKKLLFLLCMAISFPVFADTICVNIDTTGYTNDQMNSINMGVLQLAHDDGETQPGILKQNTRNPWDVCFENPSTNVVGNITQARFDAWYLVWKAEQETQENSAYNLFDPERAIEEFYQSLQDQMFNRDVDFGKIAEMTRKKNFTGLKIYGYGSYQYGFITEDVLARYKQIFLNQDINLDEY
jgi:hypothetical protein